MVFSYMSILKLLTIALVLMAPNLASAQEVESVAKDEFILRAIGLVHKEKTQTTLVLNKEFESGLLGLDGFSHAWVLWWFDRSDIPKKRSTLQVHPRKNPMNPLTGVFACRSPARPNLIAISLCRVVSVKDNVVEIDGIDAFSNTPILDIKPYIPGYDSAQASVPDWLGDSRKSIAH